MDKVKVQKFSYGGWDNCIQITNGVVDVIVTTDIGPRIIRYGFVGQGNELCEIESTMGLTGGNEWRLYGGHRLWHSPEDKTRTYEPDNGPVAWEEMPYGVKTLQKVEPAAKIKKEMEISLDLKGTNVRILHRLTNASLWPLELSVWSISAMAPGGKEIIPQTNIDTGLLPNRIMSLWPYTRLNDTRIAFSDKYIMLRQDSKIKKPFKFGISNESGWAAYFNHDHLFVKYYSHHPHARYPDFGVSYETYVNEYMLEMETLSPLALLKPSAFIEHEEKWELFNDIQMPSVDDDEIDRLLTGTINPIKKFAGR